MEKDTTTFILPPADTVKFDTITDSMASNINWIDQSNYAMTTGVNHNIGSAIGVVNTWGPSISTTFNADTTEYSKTTIKTANNTIDLDELADLMTTLKKRLLILTPAFEKHEKYPMLKELYNEYRAMEALLLGSNSNE